MNDTQRRHWFVVLLIVVLAILCGVKLWDYMAHLKKYEEMPTTAAVTTEAETEPETTPPETEPEIPKDPDLLRVIDFRNLKEKNEDVVGWIYIPGTIINYPVLWRKDDNNYYLHRDIDRREGSYDGIFMDGSDTPDMSQRQILFYGHHMKNGTMFTQVCDFKEEEFFKEHRKAYFYTPDHTYALRTMACLYTDSGADKRKMEFEDQLEFDAYVNEMTKRCSFREIPEGGVEKLFTLVTCSYEFNDARTLLYCYEVDEEGNPVHSSKDGSSETHTESDAEETKEETEEETKEEK